MKAVNMPICWNCGEPIVIRIVDGVPTPIHLHGGWCSGAKSSDTATQPFRNVSAFVNPNALCPVCGDRVFFFQSRFGGRVFFDALGWPWPKHPCTDNRASQTRQVQELRPTRGLTAFRNRRNEPLDIYELSEFEEIDTQIRVRLRRIRDRREFWVYFSSEILEKNNILIDDFWDAPSFIIKKENTPSQRPIIEFISARLKKIIRIKMHRDAH